LVFWSALSQILAVAIVFVEFWSQDFAVLIFVADLASVFWRCYDDEDVGMRLTQLRKYYGVKNRY